MSVVVALEHAGGVTVACDSFLGNNDLQDKICAPKWWRAGQLLVAWAGDLKIPQIVEHAGWRMRQRKGEADQAFVRRYAERVRQVHLEKRVAIEATDYLLVYKGKCYVAQYDASLVRSGNGYAAIGVGDELALGALALSLAELPLLEPKKRLGKVLDAVLVHCTKVAKDWLFEFVPTEPNVPAPSEDVSFPLG